MKQGLFLDTVFVDSVIGIGIDRAVGVARQGGKAIVVSVHGEKSKC